MIRFLLCAVALLVSVPVAVEPLALQNATIISLEEGRAIPVTLAASGAGYVHPQLYALWSGDNFEANADNAVLRRQIGQQQVLLRALAREQVPILAGSDAGNPTLVPGVSLHDELGHLTKSGLSPLTVLRTATSEPTRVWKLPPGDVCTGCRADLVVLDRDPLADIAALRQPYGVLVNGLWLDRPRIDAMLARAKAVHAGAKP